MNRLGLILAGVTFVLLSLQTLPIESQEEGSTLSESPPSEVTILRGRGVREEANTCPRGMTETRGEDGLRYCYDPKAPPFGDLSLLRPPIAGIPYWKANEILGRHYEELISIPEVQTVVLGAEAIMVWTTDAPEVVTVPSQIEGVPVQVHQTVESRCGRGTHWDVETQSCQEVPSWIAEARKSKTPFKYLPPPPGVIILRPGGIREEAESCPQGFGEHESVGGWRFCLDPKNREPIPPLMAPPIAGTPYEEALAIMKRNQDALMKLPGVRGVGLNRNGLLIMTNKPEEVPMEVEGLPVTTGLPLSGSDM